LIRARRAKSWPLVNAPSHLSHVNFAHASSTPQALHQLVGRRLTGQRSDYQPQQHDAGGDIRQRALQSQADCQWCVTLKLGLLFAAREVSSTT
jgi:hypothetical protein